MKKQVIIALAILPATVVLAGPYSPGKGGAAESGFVDAGIAGFVGPAGDGVAADATNGNYLNPVFKGWASSVVSYTPSDYVGTYGQNGIGNSGSQIFGTPSKALGSVTGNNMDTVSLGDMHMAEINSWVNGLGTNGPGGVTGPGTLVLKLSDPIANRAGADFAAFENGFVSNYDTGAGSAKGMMFAELGFVEVSTDGVNFARFPVVYSNYLNATLSGKKDSAVDLDGNGVAESIAYLTQDVSNIYNMVGKHANAYSACWGTPFNLDDLANDPLVLNGTVDLNKINYVKIVDAVGDGTWKDSQGHSIYDAWVTWGSGGLDFEALGVINYAGKTLSTTWDSVADASTRAFVNSSLTLTDPTTVGALQFDGGFRLDGATITLSDLGSREISLTGAPATAVIASDIAGAGGVTITGGNTIVFEGAKSYTGETIVQASTLKGTVAALSRDITNNGTVEFVNDTQATFANVISGTGNLRVGGNGDGVLTVNTPQTYAGNTQIIAGVVKSGVDNLLADTTVVDVSSGASLDLNGHHDTIGGLSGAGQVSLGGANLTLGTKGGAFSGGISGNGNLAVAADTATHTLSGANSFVGSVALKSGTLAVNSDASLGNASNPLSFEGGTLQITGTTMHGTNRTIGVSSGAQLKLNVADATNRFDLGANLSGDISLGLYGPGVVALSGTNTHTGGTKLKAGTLEISSQSQLGTGTLDFDGGALRVAGKGISSLTHPLSFTTKWFKIDVADADHTLNVGAEIQSDVSLYKYGAGTVLLTAARTAANNYAYDGTVRVQNASGMSGIMQLYGDSRLVLSNGVTNTKTVYVREQSQYILEGNASATGAVNLYGGTLILGDDATVSSLALTNGGTVAGTGRVKGNATFGSNNILSPGQSVGTLEFENVLLTMNTGSTYRFEIDVNGSDLISGVGTNDQLTLQTGGIIDLVSLDGTDPLGKSYTLFSGFETISGSLDTWTVRYDGQTWNAQFSQETGELAMVVPEPGALASLAVGGAALLLRRRRRV